MHFQSLLCAKKIASKVSTDANIICRLKVSMINFAKPFFLDIPSSWEKLCAKIVTDFLNILIKFQSACTVLPTHYV